MKFRIFFISVLLVCALFLSSCSFTSPVLTVGSSAELYSDVFAYFVYEAMCEDPSLDEDEILTLATTKCVEYVAVNSTFASLSLTLSGEEKAALALETNTLWRQWGEFYTDLGLTRQDFYKIMTSSYYREALRDYYFGTGGEYEVSEDDILALFVSNYVGFQCFYNSLSTVSDDGEQTRMSDEEIDELYNYYLTAASEINNSGANITEAYASFASDEDFSSMSIETIVIDDSSSFPDGFFEAVLEADYDTAIVIISDDYIYLVIRQDISSDETLYEEYRDEALAVLTDSLLDSIVNDLCTDYTAERDLSRAQKIYDDVVAVAEKYSTVTIGATPLT